MRDVKWSGYVLLAGLNLCSAWPAAAQQPAVPPSTAPSWEVGVSGALYVLEDEENFLQPTIRADRGVLHLEARYNYEDRNSGSFFAGANVEFGEKVTLALTPMLGGLVGDTDGIVPGLEMTVGVWRLEAYGEAEYVIDLADRSSNYFYLWSEVSVRATDWFRAGIVAQRTRVYQTERDIQRGLLMGFAFRRLDATVYVFNPGSDDHSTVMSFGLSF